MTQELILIRGVPGTGKSTRAKEYEHRNGYVHCEADQYFVGEDGVYRFDIKKIATAHHFCQQKAEEALRRGRNVVVSNTFTRRWEMEQYYNMACEIGCNVRVITLTEEFGSIHNVPTETMKKMRDRFQK